MTETKPKPSWNIHNGTGAPITDHQELIAESIQRVIEQLMRIPGMKNVYVATQFVEKIETVKHGRIISGGSVSIRFLSQVVRSITDNEQVKIELLLSLLESEIENG